MHGEAGLTKIKDEKSRKSKYAMHGETVRLENASSKALDESSMQSKMLRTRREGNNAEAVTAERSNHLKSPKPSNRTEDAYR